MQITIKILGLFFTLTGVAYLILPEIIKRQMDFLKKGRRIYFSGLIRFVLAIIFLISARKCEYFWVILILGNFFLLSGTLIFIIGPEKIRQIFDWYQMQSLFVFRLIALIVWLVGIVVIYSA
ncbi:hypothetical protein ACFLZ8_00970 [Planctomycetota bacterium]